MAEGLGTTVTIRGESSQFKQSIEEDIAALRAMGQTIDVTHRGAVAAWRDEVQAQREVMQQLGATESQLKALNDAVAGTEKAIASADAQMGRSFTTMSRGMFMIAGQQNDVLASSRGIVTLVGAAALQMGSVWAPAVAIATLALLRFFDKADEGWKTFETNLKRASSEIEKLLPADMEDRANRLTQELEQRMRQQELLARQAALSQNPIEQIQTFFKTKELVKEQEALEAEISRIRRDEIPAKQQQLEQEAYHAVLLRQQQSVMKDLEALDKARTAGVFFEMQGRLQLDQAALQRTRADIARIFPASGATGQVGAAFGRETSAFDEQLRDRARSDADTERAKKELERTKELFTGAERAIDAFLVTQAREHPQKTWIELEMERLGVGQQDLSGKWDPLVAQVKEIMRKTSEEIKKEQKGITTHLGDPGMPDHFITPPSLTGWEKFKQVMSDVAMSIEEPRKKMRDLETASDHAAKVLNASFQSAIDTAVQAHRESVGLLTAAALQPIVTEMEALAVKYAVEGVAAGLTGNFIGAAKDLAAAAAITAGAHEVASWASGLTTHGGAGGGSGGGGSGGSLAGTSVHGAALGEQGISALGAQRAAQANMRLEVIITNKAPDGRTLQQYRTLLQRLDDRNVPPRVNIG